MDKNSWGFRMALLLLVVSLGLYVTSLFLEIFEIERDLRIMGIGNTEVQSYRLFGTIESLWNDGEIMLAVIITAFSFVFPVTKYLALGTAMLSPRARLRERMLRWVKNFGQWSMGDVFVVALMVVIVRVDRGVAQIGVQPQTGLWVFAASVILTMVVSGVLNYVPGSFQAPAIVDDDADETDDAASIGDSLDVLEGAAATQKRS